FNLAQQLRSVKEQATLERLRQHLEVVEQFAETIQTTLDISALIERTLDELFRVFHKVDAGVIFLRDESNGQLSPAAIRCRREQLTGPVGYSTTILKFVEAEHKAVLNLDVSQDARFQHAASVQLGSMRTHMCVPLVVRGEVVGAIYLVAEGTEQPASGFDADDLALLSALSGAVAVCVKNASLAREAQRNARLSSSLQRYVSAEVTRRLIQTGVEGALGARVSDGIAMFCDLVGFTTLSERLTPERMARILNRYFRRALEIVFTRQGSVNKFGGDSFLAVWGAIDPAPADISSVATAALEIQNDTFRLSTELTAEGLDPIQLTIGLNRGRFFAGDIGSDDRMEFTVIGDTVNVAARIQALAHGGQVLASLDSLDAARSRMGLVLYPDIAMRGRTAGVTIASIRSIVTHQAPESSRLLTHIPVELPELGARGILVAALLDGSIEVDVLIDRPGTAGQVYQLVPLLPEWEGACSPAEAACLASIPDKQTHLVKLELSALTRELKAVLSPGSEQLATRSLRKKA
ncbi:MAG: GAF domain-containing protein, partial [Planctomycetes bacterium]|nr:GAF domain-containing protein [Planctomycetota bacterium]